MKKIVLLSIFISSLLYAQANTVTVTSPNGGERWQSGTQKNITWSFTGAIVNVKIEINNGTGWFVQAASVAAVNGTYAWTVPVNTNSNYQVRISDAADAAVNDVCDAVFSVVSLSLTSPNGGERWQSGTLKNITWAYAGDITNVKIETNDGTGWSVLTASVAAVNQTYSWTVSNTSTSTYQVRVSDVIDATINDVSDAVFAVVSLSLTSPDGGEHLQIGKTQAITWAKSTNISNVKLEYTTDNGASWYTIIASQTGTSYSWTVPNVPGTTCKIRVSDVAGTSTVYDESAAIFTIASLVLSFPNGAENILQGSTQAITWASQNITNVKIEYSADAGANYTSITNSTAASAGTYNWVVPNNPTTNYLIRISDAAYASVNDESNQIFTVSSLSLTAPAGGVIWQGATSQNITWTSANITNVKIEYSIDNGANWLSVINTIAANTGTYAWTIPNNPSVTCKVKISDISVPANFVLSNAFTITPIPNIQVTSPNGFEKWQDGSAHNITWTATSNVIDIKIEFSNDNGVSWSTLTASIAANLGTYSWTVPTSYSQNCKIKITSTVTPSVTDESDNTFTIGGIGLTSPNGGEKWQTAKSYNITWTSVNVSNVKLEYSSDNGTNWNTIAATIPASSAPYSWIVPVAVSAQYKVRISDVSNSSVNDESNAVFTVASLQLTSPNGAENWMEGSVHPVTWSSANVTNVKLEYTTNGTVWTSITNSTAAAAGTYSWTLPNSSAATYIVRISDAAEATINDQSDINFTISKLNLTAPVGGESWKVGTSHDITWQIGATVTNVKLDYTIDNGNTWLPIVSSILGSTGTYRWIIPNTPSINCKVRVSSVNSPDVQSISTLLFTITKSLIVLAPNGGEKWEIGSVKNIRWSSDPVTTNVRIEYSINGGGAWSLINAFIDATLGTYAWTVPNTASANCLVRITDVDNASNSDVSDAAFTIQLTPGITITRPNGGETFETGASENITWTSTNISFVSIYYSINNGSTWNLIVSNLASTGSYSWSVPNLKSTQCKIKISDYLNDAVYDLSDNTFNINPRIVITSPNGGESLPVGAAFSVTWTSVNVANVKIEYSTDSGTNWNSVVASTPAAAGNYSWTTPNSPSSNCIIKISDVVKPEIYDMSDNVFAISSRVTILTPNGGESWQTSSTHDITWTSNNITNLALYYTTNNGSTWNIIAQPIAASAGVYPWVTPVNASSLCKIKITDFSNPNVFDVSDNLFSISSLSLTKPNGSENYPIGSTQTITWTSIGISNVKLEYSTNNGSEWQLINASVPSNGMYYWDIPNSPSIQCKVRVSDVSNLSTIDVSDNTFIISESPTITVLYPNLKETFGIGTTETIKWKSSSVSNVKIEYSINGGTSWQSVIASTASSGTYGWLVPNSPSTLCKIRISDSSRPGVLDASDSLFTITSAPKLALTAPNGDENYAVGSSQSIKWTSTNVSNIKIEYSINGGNDWYLIESSYPSSGIYAWAIPNQASVQCKVRISDTSNPLLFDMSDKVFSISMLPVIKVLSPNKGEIWEIGKTQFITWTSTDVTNVKIEYSINNGTNWNSVVASTQSTGSYAWIIPSAPSFQCKVKISDLSKPSIYDASDSVFTIAASPKITLSSPNGGEIFKSGSIQNILWTSTSVENVKLEYSINNGVSWRSIIETITSTGSYLWTVPNTPSNQCRVRISDAGNGSVIDVSDLTFSIVSITLLTPENGDALLTGAPYHISWETVGVINVKIEYSTDNGITWVLIIASVKASYGAYDWVVPQLSSRQMKIRISDVTNRDVFDQNTGIFSIQQIVVLSPIDNVRLRAGTSQLIQWRSYNVANVKLEYSDDNGGTWKIIAATVLASLPNYPWNVPASNSDYCIVRISDVLNNTNYGIGNFSISIVVGIEDNKESVPSQYQLMQNYPNPFNPTTTIEYRIPTAGFVTLRVFDVLGHMIAELVKEDKSAGTHIVRFDGNNLPSGIYLYNMYVNGLILSKKFILLK